MTKSNRKIVFISYAFIGLLTESLIYYLFPYTGLGGLICYPICVVLSVLFGWILYKFSKHFFAPLVVSVLFLLLITIQFIIEFRVHPQDFGGSPLQQIDAYKQAYQAYDTIKFDSFAKLGKAERVAYIYKFKDKLPSSVTTLIIDSLTDNFDSKFNRKYMFSNYAHDTIYDKSLLKIIQTDTSLIIIEHPNNSLQANVHITDKNLLNYQGGGIYDRNHSIMYNVSLDNLELNTGIDKLFYKYLSMTKNASR